MKTLLAHWHVFYEDQVPYFLQKLSHIQGVDWDLVVTFPAMRPETRAQIAAVFPKALFLQVENAGYDIWPFIRALREAGISNYRYVLKLHTKNASARRTHIGGVWFKGHQWRNMLVDALLRTPGRLNFILKEMEEDPSAGMACNGLLLRQRTGELPEESDLLARELERIGLTDTHGLFCAGTMFLSRASVLEALVDAPLSASDFGLQTATHQTGSLAHAYERILGVLVESAGCHFLPQYPYPLRDGWVRLTRQIQPALEWMLKIDRETAGGPKVLVLFGKRFVL